MEAILKRTNPEIDRRCGDLYGLSSEGSPNAVEVYVHRLRKQLAAVDASVQIHTLRGVGYLITEEK